MGQGFGFAWKLMLRLFLGFSFGSLPDGGSGCGRRGGGNGRWGRGGQWASGFFLYAPVAFRVSSITYGEATQHRLMAPKENLPVTFVSNILPSVSNHEAFETSRLINNPPSTPSLFTLTRRECSMNLYSPLRMSYEPWTHDQ